MQPKSEKRFIIKRSDSDPPQYFQTKEQVKVRAKRQVEDVTIHRICGFWGNSQAKASVFTDNTRALPEGCEFVERSKGPSPDVEKLYDRRYHTRLRPGPL